MIKRYLTYFIFSNIILVCFINFGYSQTFSEINIALPQIDGNVSWGDFDNDEDLDILISGVDSTYGNRTRLYRNDGMIDSLSWKFTEIHTNLPNSNFNLLSFSWGDFDNDGDLDILLYGGSDNNDIFLNDGPTSDTSWNFIALNTNMLSVQKANGVTDYDNDGDLDFLITGANYSTQWNYLSLLYRNDGNGLFTEMTTNIEGVSSSALAWGDYDNDFDMDLFIQGANVPNTISRIAKIYRNDGQGIFNELGFSLTPVTSGTMNFGDFDSDGDLDFFHAGLDSSPAIIYKLYRNDGSGAGNSWNFTEIFANLSTASWDCAEWADFDNDGDLDLLKGGWVPQVYRNDGNGGNNSWNFTSNYPTFFNFGVRSLSVGDYDGDYDLDVLLSGYFENPWISYYPVLKLYRNENPQPNNIPSPPTQLNSIVIGDSVILNWNNGSDNETPIQSLSYNLRVGTTSGGNDVISPMSDDITGYRKITKIGNCNLNNSWYIKNLADGIYYWSIQAIDNSYYGSVFSIEDTFIVNVNNIEKDNNPIPNKIEIYPNYPDPFNSITKIKYKLFKSDFVKIEIFDLYGQKIETLVNKVVNSGTYEAKFDAKGLSSGIYMFRITAGKFQQVDKMLFIK